MKKSAIIIILITLGAVALPQIVFAAVRLNVPIGSVRSVDDLGEYIRIFYEFFVTSAGILAAVMMVIGGYKWITAAGNPSMISGAKEQIMSAVFGLVLALTSYLLLNTINPSITSLAPLVIPVVEELAVEGVASRLCNFTSELDNTSSPSKPVECGKVILVDPQNSAEKCLGMLYDDRHNICQINKSGGAVDVYSGIEVSEIRIDYHNITSQTTFDVNNNEELAGIPRPCGQVFFRKSRDRWEVATHCSDVNVEGVDYHNRCIMEGSYGDFEQHDEPCSDISQTEHHESDVELTVDEVKSGCGIVTNMRCAE